MLYEAALVIFDTVTPRLDTMGRYDTLFKTLVFGNKMIKVKKWMHINRLDARSPYHNKNSFFIFHFYDKFIIGKNKQNILKFTIYLLSYFHRHL